MMSVLITAGHNPFSAIIRRLTREPASHVAIRWNAWVLHSNLNGVQWQSLDSFKLNAEIINEIPIEEDLERLLKFSAAHVERGRYDIGGLLYCGLRLSLRSIGIRIPKKNLWQMTGMFMCTELVTAFVYGIEDAMITPTQLGQRLKGLPKKSL